MLALVQHLCVNAPDRADARARVAAAVITIIQALHANTHLCERCLAFVARAARSPKLVHRGFAVELSARLLCEPWLWEGGEAGGVALVDVVVSRYVPVCALPYDERCLSMQLSLNCSPFVSMWLIVAAVRMKPSPEAFLHACKCFAKRCVLSISVQACVVRYVPSAHNQNCYTSCTCMNRCSDKAPTVRSKAAAALSSLLELMRGANRDTCPEGLRNAIISSAGWNIGASTAVTADAATQVCDCNAHAIYVQSTIRSLVTHEPYSHQGFMLRLYRYLWHALTHA